MKKFFRKFILIASLSIITLCLSASAYAKIPANPLIKVGLKYNKAISYSYSFLNENPNDKNLNYTYNIGYIEGDRTFKSLFSTKKGGLYLSVIKDSNFYYSKSKMEISNKSFDSAVNKGNVHLEVSTLYTDIAKAVAEADRLSQKGVNAFVAGKKGDFKIRINSYIDVKAAESDINNVKNKIGNLSLTAISLDANTISVFDRGTGNFVFESTDNNLAVSLNDNGEDYARFKLKYDDINRYYRGVFHFKRINSGDMQLVNILSVEEYLRGVVPNEMSPSWPQEALKAQSVCARNLAINSVMKSRHTTYDFDMCDTTHCQAYYGLSKETSSTKKSIEDTKNMVLLYDESLAQIYYHALNGGYTESIKNAWGGSDIPYLSPVEDKFEDIDLAIKYGAKPYWESSVSQNELGEYLRSKGYKIDGNVYKIETTKTNPAGNVFEIKFYGSNNTVVSIKNTDAVRIALGNYVRSPRFDITSGGTYFIKTQSGDFEKGSNEVVYAKSQNGSSIVNMENASIISGGGKVSTLNLDDDYTIKGSGWGHSVGMSQYGAVGRANAGQSYTDILQYYFKGTKVTKLS